MKKYTILLIVLLGFKFAFSQVGGISNSKLTVVCSEVIPYKTLEFEPAMGFGWSAKQWDSDKKLINSFASDDMSSVFSEYGYRMTYGLAKGVEIGINLPSDISSTSWGIKYQFLPNEEGFAMAGMLGLNVPLGNKIFDKSN